MVAMARWLARESECHRTGSGPTAFNILVDQPELVCEEVVEDQAHRHRRHDERHQDPHPPERPALRFASSTAAITRAMTTWGTEDRTKMLKVLPTAFQK